MVSQNIEQFKTSQDERSCKSPSKRPRYANRINLEVNKDLYCNTTDRVPLHIQHMQHDKEERIVLSKLRLRKHHRKVVGDIRSLQNFKVKIEKLKEQDEALARISEIQTKSRGNSSRRQNIARTKARTDRPLFQESFRSGNAQHKSVDRSDLSLNSSWLTDNSSPKVSLARMFHMRAPNLKMKPIKSVRYDTSAFKCS